MKTIDRRQIAAGLKKLGLRKGDIVLLHSALSSLGTVEDGAQTVVDAFLDVLGAGGTLVAPTFGALGVITDAVKNHPDAIESVHPYAKVAAIGAKAAEICRDHWKAKTAHAEDTPYLRIAELGGYVCLLGVDQDRNTTLHTVEELLHLPYMKPKKGVVTTAQGTVDCVWHFFPGPHRDFIGLDRLFRKSGKMRMATIGTSVVRLIKSRDLIDIALEAGRNNPAFVLCDNPNCQDCVAQRADIMRSRLSTETFRLAASAALAGRYAPEIIENAAAAGIKFIELDCLEGRPIHLHKPDKIMKTVAELREAGCDISALRSVAVSSSTAALIAVARDCAVARVVAPLGTNSILLAEEAAKHSVHASFYNLGLDSQAATNQLTELRALKLKFGFTFNAAGFAAAGEKPFLFSYKQKLKRFVDQVDVEDALFDGSPAPLAGGNAEIKEIISILRCASFGGFMTLGRRNRLIATLAETARRFMLLLENM